MVTTARQMDCITPIVASLAKHDFRTEKSCFPRIPPTTAPAASGVPVLMEIFCSPDTKLFTTEYPLIESTVQPDRKLMVLTSATRNKSRTGLIITPPPIPQIAPVTEDKKLINKQDNIVTPRIFTDFFFLIS